MKLNPVFLTAVALLGCVAHADLVVTKDGSSINGKVLGIDKGKLRIQTEFAGEIAIDQELVESFRTDEPIYLTLDTGTTYLGPVSEGDSGLVIDSSDGELTANLDRVQEGWQPGTRSPSQVRQAEAMEELRRQWAYEAAFDLTGKTGNRESTGLATSFRAVLEGPDDRLEFSARARFEETDGLKSADDARGGVDYSNNFGDDFNWYARTVFGYDAIKDIEQMFTVAAGLGYDIADTETRRLNVRAGLGYLFESYEDVLIGFDPETGQPIYAPREDTSEASLDLGLQHREVFKWGTLDNRITYTPAIGDFGNYRIVHDSSVELPLQAEGWSIRVGINNDYDSEAELSNKEELDTTYYVRMVLRWL